MDAGRAIWRSDRIQQERQASLGAVYRARAVPRRLDLCIDAQEVEHPRPNRRNGSPLPRLALSP